MTVEKKTTDGMTFETLETAVRTVRDEADAVRRGIRKAQNILYMSVHATDEKTRKKKVEEALTVLNELIG